MSRQRTMEKIMESEYVSIGELVRLADSRYSTLKFYVEEGMLPFEQEDSNLTRRFKRIESVEIIEEIKTMREKGMTIPQVKDFLTGSMDK